MPHAIDDRDLLAFADGLLGRDPVRRELVEAYLEANPDDAERVAAYRGQTEALHRRYGSIVHEPVPARLTAPLERRRGGGAGWRRAAAAVLLSAAAAGGGWLAGQWQDDDPAWSLHAFLDETHRAYTQAAAGGVDAPPPAAAGGPLTWRSVSLMAPDLGPLGYRLVDKRAGDGPDGTEMARLTYDAGDGRRFTLFLRPRWRDSSAPIRLSQDGEVSYAYWLDGPLASAVASRLPPSETLAVAQAVRDAMRPPAPAAPRPVAPTPLLPAADDPAPAAQPAQASVAVEGVVAN